MSFFCWNNPNGNCPCDGCYNRRIVLVPQPVIGPQGPQGLPGIQGAQGPAGATGQVT